MSLRIRENVPLAPLTTMHIGGAARYFTEVRTEAEAIEAVRHAAGRGWKVFVLGGGSNIIVSDRGFPGLVIANRIAGFESSFAGGRVLVRVGSGELWDEFVRRAVESAWQGVENLSGVPGTVGSAPVQNIGCYGQRVEDSIVSVRAIGIPDGEIRTFSRDDCKFRYRDSVFRSDAVGRYFITEVTFALIPGGDANISAYPDIERYFEGWKRQPSLQEMRQAVLEIRARKGMLVLPEYERYMSVGSFFKNPVLSAEDFEALKRKAAKAGIRIDYSPVWYWPQEGGSIKVAAARLLECCGFTKGYREGNVGISPKHSLAIINYGSARAEEIAAFAEKIQISVRRTFGVELEPEAQFVGTFIHSCHRGN